MPPSDTPPAEAGSNTTEPVDLSSTNPHSLHQAVYARRREYVRPHRIRVKIGTWNVAACPGTDKDLASWFVDGKGIDAHLASLDLKHNPVVERDTPTTADKDDGNHIHVLGGDKIGLYVLGLQEVIDLNAASQYVSRVYSGDPGTMDKWKGALEGALPQGYELVVSEQMSGLLLLIYASPEVAASISNVSTVSVGTGLLGYMGNKGAVVSRILLGESTRLVFVNSHLASGSEANFIERRIWDVGQILSRTQFKPVELIGAPEPDSSGEKIGEEDFAFWFGDLNFRLDGLPGDDIRHLLMLHSRGEYDLSKKGLPREDSLEGKAIFVPHSPDDSDFDSSDPETNTSRSTTDPAADADESSISLPDPDEFLPNPHDDPASLQATLDSLLPHDQLRRVIKDRKAFHDGWHEGPITFLPSYKYDVGTVGLFDSSEKQRAPSWCDRILYRTRRDKEQHDKKIQEEQESRRKDEEMKARGLGEAAEDDEVLFAYDPDNDVDESETQSRGTGGFDYDEYDENDDTGDQGGEVVTREGFVDRIHLELYTSHQRISSSDHKPIVSVFTLDYDAVVAELKAKIHAEVARELDRAENEGRPGITIVVDSQDKQAESEKATEGHIVNFGEVGFLKKATSVLTLANTGGVPATFSFVEKPTTEEMEGASPPQWLTTSFIPSEAPSDDTELVELGKEVTLEPGETVNALLEVLIDDLSHARLLNGGEASLEEVLVLRVTDGRDHFIPARATWAPTCIGRSIDELIRVPMGGIREFVKSLLQKKGTVGSIPYDLDVHSAAPRELFHLTEALERLTERALADEQMLDDCPIPKDAGWPFEESSWAVTDPDLRTSRVIDVIEALDTGKSVMDAFSPDVSSIDRLETVAEVMILFLRGLTDGIITTVLWNRIDQASLTSLSQPPPLKISTEEAEEDDKSTVLDILSAAPNHNISFVFLTAALAKMSTDLAPISKADVDALKAAENSVSGSSGGAGAGAAGVMGRGIGIGVGVLGRRSLSFRRSTGGLGSPTAEALAALEKRLARERRFAEVFGLVVCRVVVAEGAKAKERKSVEEKARGVVELFLRRRDA